VNGQLKVNIDITAEWIFFYSLILSLHSFDHLMCVDRMLPEHTDVFCFLCMDICNIDFSLKISTRRLKQLLIHSVFWG
jgi:hypothetical protein